MPHVVFFAFFNLSNNYFLRNLNLSTNHLFWRYGILVFSFWFFKRILENANIGNWQLHISTLWSQETLWHVSYCKSFQKKVFLDFGIRSFEKLFLFLRYVLFFLEFLINFHFFGFFRCVIFLSFERLRLLLHIFLQSDIW